jgi:hypothetical protein
MYFIVKISDLISQQYRNSELKGTLEIILFNILTDEGTETQLNMTFKKLVIFIKLVSSYF